MFIALEIELPSALDGATFEVRHKPGDQASVKGGQVIVCTQIGDARYFPRTGLAERQYPQ